MVEIKHTLCPSCSVGCGISIITNGDEIGTFPYKRHPINEGKNCLNGRKSIEIYKNRLVNPMISNSETDLDNAINSIVRELKSKNADKITIISSGNNTNEELESIKNFADSKNYNFAIYADNMKGYGDVASYDEIESASKVFVIGDILYKNPLAGRRIVHAKKNGAKIIANGLEEESITFNIADECNTLNVEEFVSSIKGQLDDSSIILFNYLDSFDDFDVIVDAAESANAKILPLYSNCNTKGALKIENAKPIDEIKELLSNTDMLLVFNDDIINEIDFDYQSISTIITFAPCLNDTAKISNIIVPIKSW